MAYLYARDDGRGEIRESQVTEKGPRSRTLVSFKGVLRPEHLERAESAARRPIDRERLIAKARSLGVPVEQPGAGAEARQLIARLRAGHAPDPVLVHTLRRELDALAARPVPDALEDVVEWVGATDHERGHALRDVLRLYDTIAQSREPVREPAAARFPRFEVRPARRAS